MKGDPGKPAGDEDRNFDDAVEHFERNIYGSAKGAVRLAVMQDHLQQHLPQAQSPDGRLQVLDIGCGLGQFGLELARQGHRVCFNDLSERMLERVREHAAAEPEHIDAQAIDFLPGPLQSLGEEHRGQYDLVLFHAVLEWLADPQQGLRAVTRLLRPGGRLSLSFYNRDALVFRNLIRGNWRQAERKDQGGRPGGLTPYHPLTLEQVETWLRQQELETLSLAGIRVILDYLPPEVRQSRDLEETIRIEKKFSRHPLYARLGRYLHLVAERKSY